MKLGFEYDRALMCGNQLLLLLLVLLALNSYAVEIIVFSANSASSTVAGFLTEQKPMRDSFRSGPKMPRIAENCTTPRIMIMPRVLMSVIANLGRESKTKKGRYMVGVVVFRNKDEQDRNDTS